MLKKFIKYTNLLDITETKLSHNKDGKISIQIDGFPFRIIRYRSVQQLFRARRELMIALRRWRRLNSRMMKDAEPYLVSEAL
jgi:hypothetical protein